MSDLVGNPEDRFSRVAAHLHSRLDVDSVCLPLSCCDVVGIQSVRDKLNLAFKVINTRPSELKEA